MEPRKTSLAALTFLGLGLAALLPGRGDVDLLAPSPSGTLTFEPGDFLRVSVPDTVNTGRILWALPYTLVNETGRNRSVALEFMLLAGPLPLSASADAQARKTPDSHWIRAKDDAPARERVAQVTGMELASEVRMQGILRDGERRSGVALFEGVPFESHHLQVLVSGLSAASRVEITEKRNPRPDTYRQNLRSGARVVRYAARPGGYEILPLVRKVTPLEFASTRGKDPEVFERGSEDYYRYTDDPILKPEPGTVLLRRWIYHLGYQRTGETSRGKADYTEQTSRGWILALCEPAQPAPKTE